MKISLDHFSSHQLEEQGFDLTFVDQLSNREELPGFYPSSVPRMSMDAGIFGHAFDSNDWILYWYSM